MIITQKFLEALEINFQDILFDEEYKQETFEIVGRMGEEDQDIFSFFEECQNEVFYD